MMRLMAIAIICLSFGIGEAQLIPPAAITETIIHASPVQIAAGQPQLYCAHDSNGHIVGCWDHSKYKQMANQSSRLTDYNSQNSNTGLTNYDGQYIEVPNPKAETRWTRVTIDESVRLHDPISGKSFNYNFNTPSGQKFRQKVASFVGALPSAIHDFQSEQQQYRRIQQTYQNFYSQTASQNAQLAHEIQAEAGADLAQAKYDQSQAMTNFAEGLANLPVKYMSLRQLKALQIARKLAANPLADRVYRMNSAAYARLSRQFEKAVQSHNGDRAFALLEPLTRAEVDNHRPDWSKFRGQINHDGVMNLSGLTNGKLQGPYDHRHWINKFNTVEGEIVRRTANKFQQIYLDTDGLSILQADEKSRFVAGQIALSVGDQDLSNGLYERGSSFLSLANMLVDSIGGFSAGVGDSAVSLVKSIPELAAVITNGTAFAASNPVKAWEDTVQFARSLPELSALYKVDIERAIESNINTFQSESVYARARFVGKAVFNVATVVGTLGEGAAADAAIGATDLATVTADVPKSMDALALAGDETTVEDIGNATAPNLINDTGEVEQEPPSGLSVEQYKRAFNSPQELLNDVAENDSENLERYKAILSRTEAGGVETYLGEVAEQEYSRAALDTYANVEKDGYLYRVGEFGKTRINFKNEGAQFWSFDTTLLRGNYSDNVAAAFEKPDFIEIGRVKPGARFVTKQVADFGSKTSDAIEVVIQDGGMKTENFINLKQYYSK